MCQDDRFRTLNLGRAYIVEYDRVEQEMRLCWSGGQTFFQREELCAFSAFLTQVLGETVSTPPEKPITYTEHRLFDWTKPFQEIIRHPELCVSIGALLNHIQSSEVQS